MSTGDAARMDGFTATSHHTPAPAIDPSQVRLSQPYVVCIIGASRGIGEGIVHSYAKAGASGLILASRSVPALEDVATKARAHNSNAKIETQFCDLSNAESVDSLAHMIKNRFGRLDVVVVNSGVSGPVTCRVTEGQESVFQEVTDVNYIGTYHAAHSLVPLLLSSQGGAKAFIAVGSIAAVIVAGPIANTQYCVSKLAQAKLVEHISEQYKSEGLFAISIHPGAVKSKMAMDTAPPEFMKYLVDDANLCGAFCVELTKARNEYSWLGGRLVSANWDIDELVARKDEVVERDLLKLRISL